MKNKRFSLLLSSIALIGLYSCNKYDGIDTADNFNVSTSKLTYKAGDSVLFNFNTGPDEIIFYSGEPGKKYENKSRFQLPGVPKLVFQSSMQQGVLVNNDSLRLMVSSNLKGYDSASIVNATWTDITSRNTKWPTALTTSYTISDSIVLDDFNNADSVNIAFRFIGKKYAVAAQRKWQIQNLTLTNFLADGSSNPLFSTFANTGWVQASLKNNSTPGFMAWNVGTWNVSAANSILNTNGITIKTAYPIQFDPGTAVNVDDNDDWLITSGVNLKKVRPDIGVTVKNEVNTAFTGMTYLYAPGLYAKYLYIFSKPGVYNVTFIAKNLNGDKVTEVIRQVQLTITP